ncbi:hypothetical protein B484DRAFT_393727, partial [Ochromonadaceae sp. CCMP2298]
MRREDGKMMRRNGEEDEDGGGCTSLGKLTPEQRKVLLLRVLLTVSLFVSAVVCGWFSYFELRNNQTRQFESEYAELSSIALEMVNLNFLTISSKLVGLGALVEGANPSSEQWPEVLLPGFFKGISAISSDAMAILPIVQPAQLASFEPFMRAYFASEAAIDNTTASQTVYATDAEGLHYHDTTGNSTFSTHNILTPILQLTYDPYMGQEMLGYNLHAEP